MKNKKLYEHLIKDISKIVKKKLNENEISEDIDLSNYLDKNGLINLSDLKSLPEPILLKLAETILENDFYFEEADDNNYREVEGHFFIIPNLTNTNYNDIYLDSINSYEILMDFETTYDIDYDHYEEEDGTYIEVEVKDIIIYYPRLRDSALRDNKVDIDNEDIKKDIKDYLEDDDKIIEKITDAHEQLYCDWNYFED